MNRAMARGRLTGMEQRSLTERNICTESVLPVVKHPGWDELDANK